MKIYIRTLQNHITYNDVIWVAVNEKSIKGARRPFMRNSVRETARGFEWARDTDADEDTLWAVEVEDDIHALLRKKKQPIPGFSKDEFRTYVRGFRDVTKGECRPFSLENGWYHDAYQCGIGDALFVTGGEIGDLRLVW